MDTIKFVVEDYVNEEFGFRFPTINIFINERNLIDLVDQIERGYRVWQEKELPIAQSYVGLHPGYHRDFAREFLGQKNRPNSVLLTCTCMEELCNSICAKITLDSAIVTWSDIRNPFLSMDFDRWVKMDGSEDAEGFPIDYSALGPFVFDRRQYMEALNQLAVGK